MADQSPAATVRERARIPQEYWLPRHAGGTNRLARARVARRRDRAIGLPAIGEEPRAHMEDDCSVSYQATPKNAPKKALLWG